MCESEMERVRQQIARLRGPIAAPPLATQASRVAFDNGLVRVEENHVRRPGDTEDRTGIRVAWGPTGSCAIAVLPRLPDGRVAILLRYRYAPDRWCLEFPRRREFVEEQTWKHVAASELHETAGLVAQQMQLLGSVAGDAEFLSTSISVVLALNCDEPETSAARTDDLIRGQIQVSPECLDSMIARGDIDCTITLAAWALYRAKAAAAEASNQQ